MNYVQTTGLNKLFTDNTFTKFTPDAIASGVNYNSIIYIVCQNDTASFGPEFKDGKTLIWAKGNFYGNNSESGIFLYLTPPREYYVINDLTYYLKSPQNYPEAWEEWDYDLASATQNNEFTEEVSVQTYGFNPQFFVATKDDIETFKSEASQYNLKIFTYGVGKKRNRYHILKTIPLVSSSQTTDTTDPGYFSQIKTNDQDVTHLSFLNKPINLFEIWNSYSTIDKGIRAIYGNTQSSPYGNYTSLNATRCKSPYTQLQEIALLNGNSFNPTMNNISLMNTNAISYKMAFGIFKGDALCSNLVKGKVIFKWESNTEKFRIWFREDGNNKIV